MIFLLLISLIFLSIITLCVNNKDYITPAFLFCISFVFSTIWATIYRKAWELELHVNTYLIITLGVMEFIIVSIVISTIRNRNRKVSNNEVILIKIDTWKKVITIFFCIFTILYTWYSIVKVMDGDFSNISESIHNYNIYNKFADKDIKLPKLMTVSRLIVCALGYWFSYVVINNYFANKKIDLFSTIIVILSLVSNASTGSRGDSINILFAIICIFFVINNKRCSFKNSVDLKLLLKIGILCIILIGSFSTIGTILGRNKAINFFDYLAEYCGAEIKNLDTFIREYSFGIEKENDFFGKQTFVNLIRWLGPYFGMEKSEYTYMLTLPFRKINNFDLGNVYTTFYPYIYDFGYKGVFILVGLMAIIVQSIYEECRTFSLKKYPRICILIYSYMFNTLILSFFSNKFYEYIFNKQFIIIIILWNCFNMLYTKFNIKINERKNL